MTIADYTFDTTTDRALPGLMNRAEDVFRAGLVGQAMALLVPALSRIRRACTAERWHALVSATMLCHPLNGFLQQDPFTNHSFHKPRGYPGDASLLDLIYNPSQPPSGTTEVGAAVWQYCINAPEPTAVRERMTVLAREIEVVSRSRHDPRVFAVAAGHLREGAESPGLTEGRFAATGATFVALDQDRQSLAEVERNYGHLGVQTAPLTVRAILGRKVPLADFDLIYAAGLYDYLSAPLATRLTSELFRLLRPGGKLLIANFATGNFSVGYMESFMDWHLIYRDENDMPGLLGEIPEDGIASRRTWRGENGHVVYLEVIKV